MAKKTAKKKVIVGKKKKPAIEEVEYFPPGSRVRGRPPKKIPVIISQKKPAK